MCMLIYFSTSRYHEERNRAYIVNCVLSLNLYLRIWVLPEKYCVLLCWFWIARMSYTISVIIHFWWNCFVSTISPAASLSSLKLQEYQVIVMRSLYQIKDVPYFIATFLLITKRANIKMSVFTKANYSLKHIGKSHKIVFTRRNKLR
jgi:hypothetical protein